MSTSVTKKIFIFEFLFELFEYDIRIWISENIFEYEYVKLINSNKFEYLTFFLYKICQEQQ
jgi:hypothetical protein